MVRPLSTRIKKNFANLCQHENDFGISAEWNFFATSHGKSACDGVGGTVKRLAARASLRSPFENQIMTPQQLFTWAKNNIGGITILWVPKEMVEEKRARLTPRFSSAVPVKGTRSYHHFKPASPSTLRAGLTSYSATQEFVISKPIWTQTTREPSTARIRQHHITSSFEIARSRVFCAAVYICPDVNKREWSGSVCRKQLAY